MNLQDLVYDYPFKPHKTARSINTRQGQLGRSTAHPHVVMEQSRPYQPPDSPRTIDWKYYARHRELIVRTAAYPKTIHMVVICDLTDSMFWPTEHICSFHQLTEPSKALTALHMSLHIVHSLCAVNEPVILGSILHDPDSHTPILWWQNIQNSSVLDDLNGRLCQPEDMFLWPTPSHLQDSFEDLHFNTTTLTDSHSFSTWSPAVQSTKIIWISDLIHALSKNICSHHLKTNTFHLLSPLERSITWTKKAGLYESKTTFHRRRHSKKNLERGYMKAKQQWLDELSTQIPHIYFFTSDDPIDPYIDILSEVIG